MTIRQLSVFLENKPGNLDELLSVLTENQINIVAITVADTIEYGIARLLVSDSQLAYERLREHRFTVRVDDVLSLELEPYPGSLHRILQFFTAAGISMEYLYAFSYGNTAMVVLRTDNREKAIEVIQSNKLKSISEDDIQQ